MTAREKALRGLDVLTNVATLVAACALVVIAYRTFAAPRPPESPKPLGIAAGAAVPISGIDWTRSHGTLVMLLSTHCHFCQESSAFYQELTRLRKPDAVRIVAVFREDVSQGRAYLAEHQVGVDDVLQLRPEQFQSVGTPTLLLVDVAGHLDKEWVGKVPPDVEREIIQQLRRLAS